MRSPQCSFHRVEKQLFSPTQIGKKKVVVEVILAFDILNSEGELVLQQSL
jgi:hypothetical protein